MKFKKTIILGFMFIISIAASISLISYRKSNAIKQTDPYEIKKVQNFNYQPQHYADGLDEGSLIFLTEQGELYKCKPDGEIIKLKLNNSTFPANISKQSLNK